jgi:hypothetical protein
LTSDSRSVRYTRVRLRPREISSIRSASHATFEIQTFHDTGAFASLRTGGQE